MKNVLIGGLVVGIIGLLYLLNKQSIDAAVSTSVLNSVPQPATIPANPTVSSVITQSAIGTQLSIVTPSLLSLPANPTEQNYLDNSYAMKYFGTTVIPAVGDILMNTCGSYIYNGSSWVKVTSAGAAIGTNFTVTSSSLFALPNNPTEQNYFDVAYATKYTNNAVPQSGDILTTPYGIYWFNGSGWIKTESTGVAIGTKFSLVNTSLSSLPTSPTEQNYFDVGYYTKYLNVLTPKAGDYFSTPYGTYSFDGTAWTKTISAMPNAVLQQIQNTPVVDPVLNSATTACATCGNNTGTVITSVVTAQPVSQVGSSYLYEPTSYFMQGGSNGNFGIV